VIGRQPVFPTWHGRWRRRGDILLKY